MSRALRSMLSDAAYHAGRLIGGGDGLRMLMYHRVTDAHPSNRLCVSVAAFDAQMCWLAQHGYRTISFREAVEWVQAPASRLERPERRIVITFDDGYEDNRLHAARILEQHGLRGIFFVPSGFIQQGPEGVALEDRPMSWAQLQELLAAGHEIGAHSVSHRFLTRLPMQELEREIGECKLVLENGLRRGVDFFCYPAGDYNAAAKAMVKALRYDGACTVEPGANTPGMDVYALKRTEISGTDTLWDFEKKLAGAFDWIHAAWQRVQGSRR